MQPLKNPDHEDDLMLPSSSSSNIFELLNAGKSQKLSISGIPILWSFLKNIIIQILPKAKHKTSSAGGLYLTYFQVSWLLKAALFSASCARPTCLSGKKKQAKEQAESQHQQ